MYGNLFVTADGEGSDGVAGFRGDGCLAGELFQDFGGSCKTISGFTNGDVCKRSRKKPMRLKTFAEAED